MWRRSTTATAASDAALMADADFMAYTTFTGDMEFEMTRTLGLLEEGCAVTLVTPDTYDYCGDGFDPPALAGNMNTLSENFAASQDRINQNNMLMTCLEAIVAGQCDAEVADYITMAVVPEEVGGSVQVAMEGLMDDQLSAWIAIAGEGEATALEA